ncbi:WS/DGAT/MGAT family O-acyltransferase [Nocardioides sp. GXQ0305]|uniref:WS/DGAT/MGAT family O-acyltransferase n=1 Tax=Nocardioides sp. GXQ0305 TaxID=3423912 RepID=UPI003D7CD07E
MSQRLRPRDVALLAHESPATPMHQATVEIFDPGASGFDHERLLALVAERISFVPRYRSRLQSVPGRLAPPAWVDDPHFDLAFHVRRSALPRPGSMDQLRELVARIVSRPLDRSRPLWEVYVVEGLEGGRVAVLWKSHLALVDGIDTVDLGQVLLDTSPEPRPLGGDEWLPAQRSSSLGVLSTAVSDVAREPRLAWDAVRANTASALRAAGGAADRAGRVAGALANRRPVPESPIAGELSQQRRVVTVRTSLDDHRRVREASGGSVNDVVLATVAGALRGWLMTRAESLGGVRRVRAVAPVSVIDEELEATSLGSQIAPHWVDLPVGEPSPVVRLHQVSYSFEAHRGVAADRLAGMSGFAPATFHAVGARVAVEELRRGFQLAVTNVPGPQAPLFAGGARMLETYPVHPLLPGHALAIGVTSYDGGVFYGITADRDLLPDADVLGQCVSDALDELVDATSGTRRRAPRGRRPLSKKDDER